MLYPLSYGRVVASKCLVDLGLRCVPLIAVVHRRQVDHSNVQRLYNGLVASQARWQHECRSEIANEFSATGFRTRAPAENPAADRPRRGRPLAR